MKIERLSNKDKEIIKRNLNAFMSNFGENFTIVKNAYDKQYYIYDNVNGDYFLENQIYIAENIQHLNGWLYGCVMIANKRIKPLENIIFDLKNPL